MEQKQNLAIPVAIIIAGALIAGGLYMSGRSSAQAPTAVKTQAASLASIKPIQPTDHVFGDPKAKVVIVEYSDTECPYCKNFHSTIHQLVSSYNGKVAWVFRHFPVHSKSVNEGSAAECAAELGGNDTFWKYIDAVFTQTNSNDSLDPAVLPKIAADVGLNVTAFNTCLKSGKYEAKITQDRQDVIDAGAQGTPYSVIFANGQKIPITQGAIPFAGMKSIIDTVLKGS
jgi:protein-disulfide isomerase